MKYPGATWRPCPKHGYGNDDTHLHEGLVAHSMEGSLVAAFGELDNPNREASWTFSVAKDGRVYQHVDTDDIAWTNGSRNANKKFWGIEHEGVAGEPLTDAQRAATTALMRWLLSTYTLTPVRGVTLWEHNEMTAFGASPTVCPSGRIPWNEIIPALEENMPLTADDKTAIRQLCAEAIAQAKTGLSFDLSPADKTAIRQLCDEAVQDDFIAIRTEIAALSAKLDAHNASGAHTHE